MDNDEFADKKQAKPVSLAPGTPTPTSRLTSTVSLSRVNEDDEDFEYHEPIKWVNIIFLPFHPIFYAIATITALIKIIMGPLRAVAPEILCSPQFIWPVPLSYIKIFYVHCADFVYGVDTVLYIFHRQISDVATKREFSPKSGILIFIDILSILPLFQLASSGCPPGKLWPNILAFNELLLVYRIIEYFDVFKTTVTWKRLCGFILLFLIFEHFTISLLVLVTMQGSCRSCLSVQRIYFDWRKTTLYKTNETNGISLYKQAIPFGITIITAQAVDDVTPETYIEFIFVMVMTSLGFIFCNLIFQSIQFMHSVHAINSFSSYHNRVSRIITVTHEKNPSSVGAIKRFYDHIWKTRNGVVTFPKIFKVLPRYMRTDITMDLHWGVFYHSPTLRDTSSQFKRYISQFIRQEQKLPGERFFVGSHCFSKIYYINSGMVQFVSEDDSVTPILSVSDGTIFGDVGFYCPSLSRKVIVHCLNYCELFFISRSDYLKTLHVFPEDRRLIIGKTKERIKHARDLYRLKTNERGMDRVTDESIAWLKRRWWEIINKIEEWKTYKKTELCELPPEESPFHCAKYIGQLVLCDESKLQKDAIFVRTKFPFILQPNSQFIEVWQKIVKITVYLIILLYPPNLNQTAEDWFVLVQFCVDFILIIDVCISLITTDEDNVSFDVKWYSVMILKCKTFRFVLDVISSRAIENLLLLFGMDQYIEAAKFSRLLKAHVFVKKRNDMKYGGKLFMMMVVKLTLLRTLFLYISSYILYAINRYELRIETHLFFADYYCDAAQAKICEENIFNIFLGYYYTNTETIASRSPYINRAIKAIIALVWYFVDMIFDVVIIAVMYLHVKERLSYHFFVTELKEHYVHINIHPDLLKRIDRFLICHWKYHHGMYILNPKLLMREPHNISWIFQGSCAAKFLSQSRMFKNADPLLINALAQKARFLILPNLSALSVLGVQQRFIIWIIKGAVKREFYSDDEKLVRIINDCSDVVMGLIPVLYGRPSLRTYTAASDIEAIFIDKHIFMETLKKFPEEWSLIQNCLKETHDIIDAVFTKYVRSHLEYQKKIQDQVFHSQLTKKQKTEEEYLNDRDRNNIFVFHDPGSLFMRCWMVFRAATVFTTILVTTLQVGNGVTLKKYLKKIIAAIDFVTIVDISQKFFLGFYNKDGILITDFRKCMFHYITRGFLLDVVSVLPVAEVLALIQDEPVDENRAIFLVNLMHLFGLYIIWECFNYYCNTPRRHILVLMIFKWLILFFCVMMIYVSHRMYQCIKITWDDDDNFVNYTLTENDWTPEFVPKILKRYGFDNSLGINLIFAFAILNYLTNLTGSNIASFNEKDNTLTLIAHFLTHTFLW